MRLGQTAQDVKEHFNVGFYRNALNTLNTFEIAVNQLGTNLQALGALTNARTIDGSEARSFQSAVGHAANVLGTQKYGLNSPSVYMKKTLEDSGLTYYDLNNTTLGKKTRELIRQYVNGVKVNYMQLFPTIVGNAISLIDMGRKLESELIMLRFPLPHNLIQLLNKVAGLGNVGFLRIAYDASDDDFSPKRMTKDSTSWIRLTEAIKTYGQLKQTINVLRVALRKEIDAAQLAEQVEEETLRLENENLITREQAELEAQTRALKIQQEREAMYITETERLQNTAQEIEDLKLQLVNALNEVKAAKSIEGSTIQNIEKEQQLNNSFNQVRYLERDLNVQAETLDRALEAPTLTLDNTAIKDLQSNVKAVANESPVNKTNPVPLIAAIATAAILGA